MSPALVPYQPSCSIAPSTLPRSTNFSRRRPSESSTSTITSTQLSRRPTLDRSDTRTVSPSLRAERDAINLTSDPLSQITIVEERDDNGYEAVEDEGYVGDDDFSPGNWEAGEDCKSGARRRNGFEDVRQSFEGFEQRENERMNNLREKLRSWRASNWSQQRRALGALGGPKLVWIRSNSSASSTGSDSM